jgi:hypothetical protein
MASHDNAMRHDDGHTWRLRQRSVVAAAGGWRRGGTVGSTVVTLSGQGSGDGDHEEKNTKGKSSVLSS